MANTTITHPLSILIWVPPLGDDYKGFLGKFGFWMELARAMTKQRAEQIIVAWRMMYRDELVKILGYS